MAGFYPDVPAPKMALDKDGTQWFGITAAGMVSPVDSTHIATLTGASMTYVPDQTFQYLPDGNNSGQSKVAVVFPEPRDLTAVFIAASTLTSSANESIKVETSTNTTNGLDGTWTQLLAPYNAPMWTVPTYRTGILNAPASGIRGVRVIHLAGTWGLQLTAFHLYGSTTAGANLDRLAFWHPTLNQEVAGTHFDWGDVSRNTSAVQTFRIKNLSPTKTAGALRVALSSIVEASPTNVGAHTLSVDGTTYVSQINPANLAPGAISPVLYLRRTTASTAQPGLWMMRVFSEAGTWT